MIYTNCKPTDLIQRSARYRIAWYVTSSFLLPDSGFATNDVAEKLRAFLPTLGLIPVTPNIAVAGQPAIVFAVQVGTSFNGFSVSDIANAADRLPLYTDGVSLKLALEPEEIEFYVPLSSSGDNKALYAFQSKAITRAKSQDIVTVVGDKIEETVREGFTTLQIVALAVIVVAVAYAIKTVKG